MGRANIAFTASTWVARVPNTWFSRPQVWRVQTLCLLVHQGLRQWSLVPILSFVRCWGEEKTPEKQACSHEAGEAMGLLALFAKERDVVAIHGIVKCVIQSRSTNKRRCSTACEFRLAASTVCAAVITQRLSTHRHPQRWSLPTCCTIVSCEGIELSFRTALNFVAHFLQI